jgi:ubiquinone/menaquinone biosynthesis C-methylase UbiE
MKNFEHICHLLICPVCQQSSIEPQDNSLRCNSCQRDFPQWGDLLWFFADPEATRYDWQNRFNYFAQATQQEADQIKTELKKSGLLPQTEQRLRKLMQAKIEHNKQVMKLMEPVGANGSGKIEQSIALQVKLPKSQSLMGYYRNVLRDWSYGDDENRISRDLILQALGTDRSLGTLGVLGAGACRLAYDIHQAAEVDQTLAVDINPYLFLAAKRVMMGRNLTLYEFPITPVNLDSFAVKLKCKAPEPLKDNFHFILADAMNPSFADGSLNTVLTPWLIDIVHQDCRDLFRRLNRILAKGGSWINFGPLAFFHRQFHLCYSLEEILEIASESGFQIDDPFHEEIPYLHSPYSCQKRYEKVLCFRAVKTAEIEQPEPFHYLPDWLLNMDKPVPQLADFQQQQGVHRTLSELFAQVDGQRSISQIAQQLTPKLGVSFANAQEMIKGLLTQFFEERLKSRKF